MKGDWAMFWATLLGPLLAVVVASGVARLAGARDWFGLKALRRHDDLMMTIVSRFLQHPDDILGAVEQIKSDLAGYQT